VDLPHWANWSWGESYLPRDIHSSSLDLQKDLATLQNAVITDAASAMPVILGLGLLFRDIKRVLEYEEDEAGPDTPSYIADSRMDLIFSLAVDAAAQEVFQQVTGLLDGPRQARPTELQEGDELEQRPCEDVAMEDVEDQENVNVNKNENENENEKEEEEKEEVNNGKEGEDVPMEPDDDEDNMEVDAETENEKGNRNSKVKANVKGKGKQKQKQTEIEPRRSMRDRVPSKKAQMSM
jgi:hypothetical protein